MSDKDLYNDIEFEVNSLKKKVKELEKENLNLKQVIKDNDLEDEIEEVNFVSDEEEICINGIMHLKKLYENGTFEKNDTQQLEILVKLLMQIRGKAPAKSTSSKIDNKKVADLFKIVKSD
jgi:hypothetical protein